jgi:hypothetical protein
LSSACIAPRRRIELLRTGSSLVPCINPHRPGSSAEIPSRPWRHPPLLCPVAGPLAGTNVRLSHVWLRRGAPPPSDDDEAGGRKQGERQYRPSDDDNSLHFFSLAPSLAPASVSIVGGLLYGAAHVRYAVVQGFLRPNAVHLSAPLQPPGAGLEKGGEEPCELQGAGFLAPLRPSHSRVGVPEALLPQSRFWSPFGRLHRKRLQEPHEKPYQTHPKVSISTFYI